MPQITHDEPNMKPAAMLYFSVIEYLREEAKNLGFAIAVHGSMARDLDLLACPWTEGAVPTATLVEALRQKLELCTLEKWYTRSTDPKSKPHGRLAWSIVPGSGGGAFVDLSVMPLQKAIAIAKEVDIATNQP